MLTAILSVLCAVLIPSAIYLVVRNVRRDREIAKNRREKLALETALEFAISDAMTDIALQQLSETQKQRLLWGAIIFAARLSRLRHEGVIGELTLQDAGNAYNTANLIMRYAYHRRHGEFLRSCHHVLDSLDASHDSWTYNVPPDMLHLIELDQGPMAEA
jgi:hypothetical protein